MAKPRTILHQILDRRTDISPATRSACERAIDRFVGFAGSSPSGWTYTVGQAFYDSLRASGMRNGARTVMGHLRYVSQWHAKQSGGQDFAVVQMHTKEAREPRLALSPDEARAMLVTCADSSSPVDRRDWTLLVVGFETGMRSKSLRGMTWEGIGKHPERRYPIATVPVKGPGGMTTYQVPLSDTALQAIARWRPRGASGPVFRSFARKVGPKGRTILAENPHAISATGLYDMIKARARQAEIRHVHPHLLRHTFVTWRGLAHVPLHHIAAITGHHIEQPMLGAPKWGELPTYLDVTAVANEARNTTPQWLADLVNSICKGAS